MTLKVGDVSLSGSLMIEQRIDHISPAFLIILTEILWQLENRHLLRVRHDGLMLEQIVLPVQIDQFVISDVDIRIFPVIMCQFEIVPLHTNLHFGQDAFQIDGQDISHSRICHS